MNKQQTLESIQKAIASHEMQMEKISMAIDGQVINNPTALDKKECLLGVWLYDDDNHLRDILGSMFYDKIELYHTKWHDEYLNLHGLLFKEEEKGFFAKLVTPKMNEMDLDKAKLYYSEILETTDELLKILGASERRIEALQETKFY